MVVGIYDYCHISPLLLDIANRQKRCCCDVLGVLVLLFCSTTNQSYCHCLSSRGNWSSLVISDHGLPLIPFPPVYIVCVHFRMTGLHHNQLVGYLRRTKFHDIWPLDLGRAPPSTQCSASSMTLCPLLVASPCHDLYVVVSQHTFFNVSEVHIHHRNYKYMTIKLRCRWQLLSRRAGQWRQSGAVGALWHGLYGSCSRCCLWNW